MNTFNFNTGGFVYILVSFSHKAMYVGVTNNLVRRLHEHKYDAPTSSFVSRYNARKLVYCEAHPTIVDAIAREKQLKKWPRARKNALVSVYNPEWRDLATYYGQGERVEVVLPDFDRDTDFRH